MVRDLGTKIKGWVGWAKGRMAEIKVTKSRKGTKGNNMKVRKR